MKISDEVYVHGYIDEIRNGTIIIRNEGGYFGTAPEEVMPSAQPEQHYDEWCTDCKEYDKERHCCPRWNRVIRQTLDDVQSERKTGKWIRETKYYKDSEQEFYYHEERCSECGTKRKIGWTEVRYCPMCGARMVQEGEDND